jgi:hypothetical protein
MDIQHVMPNCSGNQLQRVDEAEQGFIVSKALNLVIRDLDCTPNEAVAAICRDWLELRQVNILSDNALAHSTPVDFKPSFFDRIKQFL